MATATKTTADDTKKGIGWLSDHIEGTLGNAVPAAKLRVILRSLVASGDIDHDAGTGWTFTGVKDPAVRAVIAKLKEQAKAPAAEKKAPAAKKAAAPRRRKAAPQPVEEDIEEFDEEDIDLD